MDGMAYHGTWCINSYIGKNRLGFNGILTINNPKSKFPGRISVNDYFSLQK